MNFKTSEEEIFFRLNVYQNYFKNKRVLDIGTRDGLNPINFSFFKSKENIGIDIDNSKFNLYESEIKKNNVKLIKINFFDYIDTEKFDVITIFKWNFSLKDYDKVIEKIKSLLKKDGKLFIGVVDNLYKYGYIDINKKKIKNTGSVVELIEKNFLNYTIINKNDIHHQWIISIDNC